MTKSEFMSRYINDYYNNRLHKNEDEKYLQSRGSEVNRKHAMHRKRSQR